VVHLSSKARASARRSSAACNSDSVLTAAHRSMALQPRAMITVNADKSLTTRQFAASRWQGGGCRTFVFRGGRRNRLGAVARTGPSDGAVCIRLLRVALCCRLRLAGLGFRAGCRCRLGRRSLSSGECRRPGGKGIPGKVRECLQVRARYGMACGRR